MKNDEHNKKRRAWWGKKDKKYKHEVYIKRVNYPDLTLRS